MAMAEKIVLVNQSTLDGLYAQVASLKSENSAFSVSIKALQPKFAALIAEHAETVDALTARVDAACGKAPAAKAVTTAKAATGSHMLGHHEALKAREVLKASPARRATAEEQEQAKVRARQQHSVNLRSKLLGNACGI
jgi:hypothetical protein